MILKNNYYCFIAGLPEVFLDDRKLALSVNGFRELAREALKKEDVKLMELFFLPADNKQVLRLLNKMAPDTNLETVYPLQCLEDEITEPTNSLPVYLNRFIADFKREHLKYDVSPENVLSWMYYDHLMKSDSKFVRNYAEFVMNVKNLETALTCRKYGKEVAPEIIGDNVFSKALRTSNSKDFGLAMEFPYVEKVISLMGNTNLVERERGLDLLLWDYIEEAVVYEYFSMDKVLSFMLELMIVERWSKMSSESGRKVFMEVVDKFRKSFEFAEEFKN
jgi:hypothetical protein